jgi:hypothetical protein
MSVITRVMTEYCLFGYEMKVVWLELEILPNLQCREETLQSCASCCGMHFNASVNMIFSQTINLVFRLQYLYII